MARILILIGAHLCAAPRPQKEAETLAEAGHDVMVRGFWSQPELAKRDCDLVAGKEWKFEPVIDFQPTTAKGKFRRLRLRIAGRMARNLYKRSHIFSPELLGYGTRKLLEIARETHADLTIVHGEAGLWVGAKLIDEGYRVGVDFEDWFSEDLLPEARLARPIELLRDLERHLLRECSYALTPSHAMAEAMAQAYSTTKPAVVYNVFPNNEREKLDGRTIDRRDMRLPSLHWFSQTVGVGRGLETLFQALPHLTAPSEIHLRGVCPPSTRRWLDALIPNDWRSRVFIHPTVPNDKLLSRIAEHDVGLALEQPQIISRDLTVTNKLFQYLQAGLAVVATDTSGQREVMSRCEGTVDLIPPNDPLALARALNNLLDAPQRLSSAKTAALKAAQHEFSWERQAEVLLESAHNALMQCSFS